jgi:hypothetical protein
LIGFYVFRTTIVSLQFPLNLIKKYSPDRVVHHPRNPLVSFLKKTKEGEIVLQGARIFSSTISTLYIAVLWGRSFFLHSLKNYHPAILK